MTIALVIQIDPGGLGEVAKAITVIGLAPTLLVLALLAYRNRTEATIKYLEEQNKQLLDEFLRERRP